MCVWTVSCRTVRMKNSLSVFRAYFFIFRFCHVIRPLHRGGFFYTDFLHRIFLRIFVTKKPAVRKLSMDELNRPDVETYKRMNKHPVVLVLDNIRSLNNIGSIFRTADALAVEKIYLTGFTAVPPHKDIHKTALGATESVDWAYEKDVRELLRRLKKEHYTVVAVEQTDSGIMLQDFMPGPKKKWALIFGNEVKGVSDEALALADMALEIPQFGTKHSFNVAVSAGIVLWDVISKLKYGR